MDKLHIQKLEHLLRTRKWNPYCFRHSAITSDSDDLPEYALKKKVRWVMDSQQGRRYIKNRMGDTLKNKILERHGIKVAAVPHMVSRICGSCGYVNKLESKFCERVGCHYPQTQLALDEIKAVEQARFQELIDKQMESKNQEILLMKEQMDKITNITYKLLGESKRYRRQTDDWIDEIPRLSESEYKKLDHIFAPDKSD